MAIPQKRPLSLRHLMFFLIFIMLYLSAIKADPQPDGGAPCQSYKDCGGIDAGMCEKKDNQSYCICFKERGNPDCSYERISKDLAGGLQFLCFIGIGGVGNFILGHNGIAVGQLILLLGCLIVLVGSSIVSCGCLLDEILCRHKETDSCVPMIACLLCLGILGSLAALCWNIVDGALILNSVIDDHNGYHTY